MCLGLILTALYSLKCPIFKKAFGHLIGSMLCSQTKLATDLFFKDFYHFQKHAESVQWVHQNNFKTIFQLFFITPALKK